MLLGKNFDDINGETILSLIESGATESVHLEFKRETYGSKDKDKREFLKDVSAFANTLGGYLIIGIEEMGGAAYTPHPLTGIDVEKELLRLECVARTGIEPPIVGLRMKLVSVSGGHLILVNVPRSFRPPHRVFFKGTNRFYGRNSSGVYKLGMEELRQLFGEQRTIEERAMTFVDKRCLRIQGGDTPVPLAVKKGVTVMHIVPLPDLGAKRQIDISALLDRWECIRELYGSGSSSRIINLDGLNVRRNSPDCDSYSQVFRNGSMELVSAQEITKSNGRNGPRVIRSTTLARRIVCSFSANVEYLRSLDVSPPILCRISFLGINGVSLEQAYFPGPVHHLHYLHETLHLPHAILDKFPEDGKYEPFIAKQMDILWNAFGFKKCDYFNEQGYWKDH